jgi:hypothetical protein
MYILYYIGGCFSSIWPNSPLHLDCFVDFCCMHLRILKANLSWGHVLLTVVGVPFCMIVVSMMKNVGWCWLVSWIQKCVKHCKLFYYCWVWPTALLPYLDPEVWMAFSRHEWWICFVCFQENANVFHLIEWKSSGCALERYLMKRKQSLHIKHRWRRRIDLKFHRHGAMWRNSVLCVLPAPMTVCSWISIYADKMDSANRIPSSMQ